ncbi:Multidrug resistance protein MdtH [Nocardia seriolae]|uniref:Multidrug resistance protein MdtH n=1 Tax=Nocardia seriolae TaxID=37332 RepID=A0ABC8AQG3_9NOCA|nr:MFS transporter [Nocardia seriolae]APA96383.1 Multidrug resistance protein MdtH [Nocardia seriolae]
MATETGTATRWPAWLTPNLRVLCGVSFLADTASELVYPILPIFLTTVLGAPTAAVGAVEGLAEAAAAATKILAGRLGDRFRKRPLIALGYGLAALGKVLVAVAVSWPIVLAGRCVDRFGKGVRGAPRDALLMVDADPAAKGRVFGVHRAADTAGAVVGPALGLALYEALDHRMRPLLFIAIVPAVAAVALIAAVREKPSAPATSATAALAPVSAEPLPGRLRGVIVLLTMFALVNFPDSLLLLRAHQLGLSVAGVIGAYIVYNLAYALLAYPAGALSDRIPRHLVFNCGLACFAIGYLGLGLASGPAWVFVVLPIYGGFAAATDGVGKAWIADLAPAARQSTAQGLYQGLSGGAILIAGLWAGLAWGGDGRIPLLISGGVGLVLAVLLVLGGRRVSAPASSRVRPSADRSAAETRSPDTNSRH